MQSNTDSNTRATRMMFIKVRTCMRPEDWAPHPSWPSNIWYTVIHINDRQRAKNLLGNKWFHLSSSFMNHNTVVNIGQRHVALALIFTSHRTENSSVIKDPERIKATKALGPPGTRCVSKTWPFEDEGHWKEGGVWCIYMSNNFGSDLNIWAINNKLQQETDKSHTLESTKFQIFSGLLIYYCKTLFYRHESWNFTASSSNHPSIVKQ